MQWAYFGEPAKEDILRDRETIHRIFESTPFRKAYKETRIYKTKIEKEWNDKQVYTKELKKITGLPLRGNFEVLLVHPDLKIGSYIGARTIEWGNPSIYENYQFVGVCHEILHHATNENFYSCPSEEGKWALHALIYLCADEELRLRIWKKAEYFENEKLNWYHPKLLQKAKELLPQWKEYLQGGKWNNIIEFFEEAVKDSN